MRLINNIEAIGGSNGNSHRGSSNKSINKKYLS
jgi:hypothetical protein